MIKNYTLIAAFLLMCFGLKAQEVHKCYAHELHNNAISNNPDIIKKQNNLEALTKDYIKRNASNRSAGTVLRIPVVVHMVHNGEAIGTGDNLSDALVNFQIARLNEDFRKQNSDTLSSTHPFSSDQADCEIEFCLATVDPSGNPTTGIVRYNGMRASWDISSIDNILKPSTIWNRYDYLNLWCVNLVDPASPGVDGYATFPSSTTDTTDGVVVASFTFGDDGGNKSIVATHEVGHYLNLLHIWGDNSPNCGNDSVADTPPAFASNSGCPTFPYSPNDSCGTDANGQMFMNYMDYSDAVCVVMFTNGQKDRMRATLTTERLSLTQSGACGGTTSLPESVLINKFTIYPNPSTGSFVVEADLNSEEATNVSIYNSLGKLVKTYNNVSFPFLINAAELNNGSYFMRLQTEKNVATKQFFIAK